VVCRLHQHAVAEGGDDVDGAAVGGGHDGDAVGGRLDERQAKGLLFEGACVFPGGGGVGCYWGTKVWCQYGRLEVFGGWGIVVAGSSGLHGSLGHFTGNVQ
jgi:hypothetical protein